MIVRYAIANVEANDVARLGQAAGINGTVLGAGFGFGAWGIEPTVIVECAGPDSQEDEFDSFVRDILKDRGEIAAYKTVNGARAVLFYADESADVVLS